MSQLGVQRRPGALHGSAGPARRTCASAAPCVAAAVVVRRSVATLGLQTRPRPGAPGRRLACVRVAASSAAAEAGAHALPAAETSASKAGVAALPAAERCTFRLGDSEVHLETGRVGRQAGGAVMATEGETTLFTTICASDEAPKDASFLPLTVVYQERFSAAGRTASGYVKRDGKQRESEVLISRLVDRPLRPVFTDGYCTETQVLQLVLSWGGVRSPDALAITAAGAALAISDIPCAKPIAGARVGWPSNSSVPIVNPTLEQMVDSRLDLVIAGTSDAVLMIEGFCDFMSEEQMLQAVEAGHAAIGVACTAISEWAARVGKPKDWSRNIQAPAGLHEAVDALAGAKMKDALRVLTKGERRQALMLVDALVLSSLASQYADSDLRTALKEAQKKAMRQLLREERLRSDGRSPEQVRPISSEAGLLPRVHGCSMFTRGETQAIAVVTLGGDADAQRLDGMADNEKFRRFYLNYFFPPSCVGEVGRVGGPSRRELGHGNLAERALLPALPSPEDFPYSIRLESTITESNGSSSMATVCAGCLALQDAGVPLKQTIAGVAMGLVLPEASGQEAIVLTDILGSEDALGDMDFKVAGSKEGITAFQMDIKVEGITLDILKQALAAARVGRLHILERMSAASPPPRSMLSSEAPRVGRMRIDPGKAGMVIGPGGKNIRSICESTGATSIQVDDAGVVNITAPSQKALDAALAIVRGMCIELEVGTIYRGVSVTSLTDFGAFVELAPGKNGLLHISEMALTRVDAVSDVMKAGDLVDVKLLEINARGQLRLSRRAVLELDGGIEPAAAGAPPSPPSPPPPRREPRVVVTRKPKD